ncbi:GDSL-type esterase/lipase family protein [Dyadobacter psychrotolerans]|uniref:GDSL family lipase n=1 Tax=Dyadobacter psychrotolerans TaxID=2541721 RepID=A0A4R5DTQ0_9BACT|nr:GDSL-type esterase/lipase family protein [Dyadobacter psychrotolerans]TDE17157.1 GDSL family lipase [Dyadobacter psychrotolerans]
MYWYEDEVVRVENQQSKLANEPQTLFYGSSSFTLWAGLNEDFKDKNPVNLGFGGSTLAACSWFFDRIVAPVKSAKSIVLYAGDNDLGDGRNPEEVCLFYRLLVLQIRNAFGDIPIFYVSIKPSLHRWEIIGKIKTANRLIRNETEKDASQHFIDIFPSMLNVKGTPVKSLFEADGLHLSAAGYVLWANFINEYLDASQTNSGLQNLM